MIIDAGITLIITPKWMFLTLLTAPYTYKGSLPVYADGYSYTGIMNIQIVE